MVKFRPHILTYKGAGTPAYKDANNNWVVASDGETVTIPCKYERNIRAEKITKTDGQDVVFKGLIFIDKSYDPIPVNTHIVVTEGETKIIETVIIQFTIGGLRAHAIYV